MDELTPKQRYDERQEALARYNRELLPCPHCHGLETMRGTDTPPGKALCLDCGWEFRIIDSYVGAVT